MRTKYIIDPLKLAKFSANFGMENINLRTCWSLVSNCDERYLSVEWDSLCLQFNLPVSDKNAQFSAAVCKREAYLEQFLTSKISSEI